MKQSKNTGKYLNDYRQEDQNFDLILCSPMLRTKKTAEMIKRNLYSKMKRTTSSLRKYLNYSLLVYTF